MNLAFVLLLFTSLAAGLSFPSRATSSGLVSQIGSLTEKSSTESNENSNFDSLSSLTVSLSSIPTIADATIPLVIVYVTPLDCIVPSATQTGCSGSRCAHGSGSAAVPQHTDHCITMGDSKFCKNAETPRAGEPTTTSTIFQTVLVTKTTPSTSCNMIFCSTMMLTTVVPTTILSTLNGFNEAEKIGEKPNHKGNPNFHDTQNLVDSCKGNNCETFALQISVVPSTSKIIISATNTLQTTQPERIRLDGAIVSGLDLTSVDIDSNSRTREASHKLCPESIKCLDTKTLQPSMSKSEQVLPKLSSIAGFEHGAAEINDAPTPIRQDNKVNADLGLPHPEVCDEDKCSDSGVPGENMTNPQGHKISSDSPNDRNRKTNDLTPHESGIRKEDGSKQNPQTELIDATPKELNENLTSFPDKIESGKESQVGSKTFRNIPSEAKANAQNAKTKDIEHKDKNTSDIPLANYSLEPGVCSDLGTECSHSILIESKKEAIVNTAISSSIHITVNPELTSLSSSSQPSSKRMHPVAIASETRSDSIESSAVSAPGKVDSNKPDTKDDSSVPSRAENDAPQKKKPRPPKITLPPYTLEDVEKLENDIKKGENGANGFSFNFDLDLDIDGPEVHIHEPGFDVPSVPDINVQKESDVKSKQFDVTISAPLFKSFSNSTILSLSSLSAAFAVPSEKHSVTSSIRQHSSHYVSETSAPESFVGINTSKTSSRPSLSLQTYGRQSLSAYLSKSKISSKSHSSDQSSSRTVRTLRSNGPNVPRVSSIQLLPSSSYRISKSSFLSSISHYNSSKAEKGLKFTNRHLSGSSVSLDVSIKHVSPGTSAPSLQSSSKANVALKYSSSSVTPKAAFTSSLIVRPSSSNSLAASIKWSDSKASRKAHSSTSLKKSLASGFSKFPGIADVSTPKIHSSNSQSSLYHRFPYTPSSSGISSKFSSATSSIIPQASSKRSSSTGGVQRLASSVKSNSSSKPHISTKMTKTSSSSSVLSRSSTASSSSSSGFTGQRVYEVKWHQVKIVRQLPRQNKAPDLFREIDDVRPTDIFTPRSLTVEIPKNVENYSEPVQTNKFYGNLLVGTQKNVTFTHPYAFYWDDESHFGYGVQRTVEEKVTTGPPSGTGGSEFLTNPLKMPDIYFSATSMNSENNHLTVTDPRAMSVVVNLHPKPEDMDENFIEMPLVQGMAFATAVYHGNLIPRLSTSESIISLVKENVGTHRPRVQQYRAKFSSGNEWLLFATLPEDNIPFELTIKDNKIVGSKSVDNLIIQAAAAPEDTFHDGFYHQSAGQYLVDADVSGKADGKDATYEINYVTKGLLLFETPLVFALPHHLESMDKDTKRANVGIQLPSATKGTMSAFLTPNLKFIENLNLDVQWGPWKEGMGLAPKYAKEQLEDIKDAAVEEISNIDIRNAITQIKDVYNRGKSFDKYAQILYVLNDVVEDVDLSKQLHKALDETFDDLRNNKIKNELHFDTTWGGITPSLQHNNIKNQISKLENKLFDDHHSNYGFYVHAAAVMAHVDKTGEFLRKNKDWINALVKDVANPIDDDFFPKSRLFDWYHGHSWASGLLEDKDAKDQVSSSEDYNFSYAMKLWGQVIKDAAMEMRGDLMLQIQKRAMNLYFLLEDNNKIMNSAIIPNKVAGSLHENKIEYNSNLGDWRKLIHGINMSPITPASGIIRNLNFVKQEWEQLLDKMEVNDGWAGVMQMNRALYDAKSAYNFFSGSDFKSDFLDVGQSKTWALTYTAALANAEDIIDFMD